MKKVKIVEEIGLNRSAVVNVWDAAEVIGPWFPEAPEDVEMAIVDLQRRLNRGEDTHALEQFLAVRIESYEG